MFTYLQRKLGIAALNSLLEQDHREKNIQWEVVTSRWKELYQHIKQMEMQMQEQQAQLRRYTLTTNVAPPAKEVTFPKKQALFQKGNPRQSTQVFYDRLLKHLPRVRSMPIRTLTERLKCSHGRASAALYRLLAEGKVERTGKGLYRAIRTEGEK
ncbi:hypothetical protein Cva_01647 [Caedimonas varicaedens]|uniref:Uncharacterized protein n=1 Tax=Caedimonas varicaedens TaxID=1629334 RepID=A0A0K8MEU7_9PROT|nr:hypothetical protein Cva_01647 [Caedimonas varicaedens]